MTAGSRSKVLVFLEMIKISHAVFALPFAVGAAFLAADGLPSLTLLAKIVLAVICARTAALAFNRLADRRLDAENPRTRDRALPRGELSPRFVAASCAVALAGFVVTAAWINDLALALSPVAIAIVLGYSYTKRVTLLCHAVLGLALALAPIGAWVAVRGELGLVPCILGTCVLLWTSGFDILYACLDAEFDRAARLHSVPARLGVPNALRVALALHVAMVAMLVWLWWAAALGGIFLGAVGAVMLLLAWEHSLVRPDDLSHTNRAFFTMNGIISFLLMGALVAEALRP